ncbi:MOSC domain-containing protein [Aquabacterium sp. J223]|uniref:MOSC domain-containing protein n=1 Tax=Aquabacterium sp. J223 TaxID=2898431 RepID=UPI0021AE0CEB|nr:MOSC N-terminal beta barrel domain-containing protein [Aquabacterium sp. J223]UUX96756.1 MOSC N-terminal beta barrel domain-containing protein [Aquabacterium sp. J223]
MSDATPVRLAGLHVYPIKSCAGVAVDESLLIETGLELDRAWMVVDAQGRFMSQRDWPRLALVKPTLKVWDIVLRAPGMLALHLRIDAVEAPTRATVWGDEVAAYDMGDLAARWFSVFLGTEARLVRFDPEQRRACDAKWTAGHEAQTAFADGFPLLVSSTGSLSALNTRLAAAGQPPVTEARFRPNLVIEGLDGRLDDHGEDFLDEIAFDTDEGQVRLKLCKPCTRCSIPDVDPATGERGHAVGDALAAYRADARMGGALTWGMNAFPLEGIERLLKVGQTGRATLAF